MSEAQHLADSLVKLLSDPQGGWFTPASVALEGLSADQAGKVPGQGFNSVWAVVNHMTYWQEYLLQRLRGEKENLWGKSNKGSWQVLKPPYLEHEWIADRESLFATNKVLSAVVASFSDEELSQPYVKDKSERHQVIQGIIAHNCYHTNEIISIRHMLGFWLKKT
jgi:uncharacterized damage-inducible protein DinB